MANNNIEDDASNLTFEKLLQAIQKLTPTIYYVTSVYAPKTDPETGEECFLKAPALFDADVEHVIIAHPELLPKLQEIAKNGRCQLVDYAERMKRRPPMPIIVPALTKRFEGHQGR